MNIRELTAKVVEAVKTRESHHCDSLEYKEADEAVNELLTQVKSDNKEFNELYNQPENWK